MKKLLVLSVLSLLALFSCSDDDDKNPITELCGTPVVVNSTKFSEATSDKFKISKVSVENNCLLLTFGAGGCDGTSWKTELVAPESYTKSQPAIWNVRLLLEDNEECEAVIQKTVSFDITAMKLGKSGETKLQIEGYDSLISYKY